MDGVRLALACSHHCKWGQMGCQRDVGGSYRLLAHMASSASSPSLLWLRCCAAGLPPRCQEETAGCFQTAATRRPTCQRHGGRSHQPHGRVSHQAHARELVQAAHCTREWEGRSSGSQQQLSRGVSISISIHIRLVRGAQLGQSTSTAHPSEHARGTCLAARQPGRQGARGKPASKVLLPQRRHGLPAEAGAPARPAAGSRASGAGTRRRCQPCRGIPRRGAARAAGRCRPPSIPPPGLPG